MGLIRSAADFTQKPWKNGGGTTEELLAFPNAADFTWRMSVASIASSGPFSLFPNNERILVLLDGAIQLSHQQRNPQSLTKGMLHHFKGDWQTDCQLLSPSAKDFNLIYHPGKVTATVTLFNWLDLSSNRRAQQWTCNKNERCFIYCAEGSVVLGKTTAVEKVTKLKAHCLYEEDPIRNGDSPMITAHPEGEEATLAIKISLTPKA